MYCKSSKTHETVFQMKIFLIMLNTSQTQCFKLRLKFTTKNWAQYNAKRAKAT